MTRRHHSKWSCAPWGGAVVGALAGPGQWGEGHEVGEGPCSCCIPWQDHCDREETPETNKVGGGEEDSIPPSLRRKGKRRRARGMVPLLVLGCYGLSALSWQRAIGHWLGWPSSRRTPAWPPYCRAHWVTQVCQGEQDPHPDPTLTVPALHPAPAHTFTLSPRSPLCWLRVGASASLPAPGLREPERAS